MLVVNRHAEKSRLNLPTLNLKILQNSKRSGIKFFIYAWRNFQNSYPRKNILGIKTILKKYNISILEARVVSIVI